jgi:hypothetical protein
MTIMKVNDKSWNVLLKPDEDKYVAYSKGERVANMGKTKTEAISNFLKCHSTKRNLIKVKKQVTMTARIKGSREIGWGKTPKKAVNNLFQNIYQSKFHTWKEKPNIKKISEGWKIKVSPSRAFKNLKPISYDDWIRRP